MLRPSTQVRTTCVEILEDDPRAHILNWLHDTRRTLPRHDR